MIGSAISAAGNRSRTTTRSCDGADAAIAARSKSDGDASWSCLEANGGVQCAVADNAPSRPTAANSRQSPIACGSDYTFGEAIRESDDFLAPRWIMAARSDSEGRRRRGFLVSSVFKDVMAGS